jgi:hypothetical protein
MSARLTNGARHEVAYVASPAGIFLETGTWFGIREDVLKQYARGVIDRRSVGQLLADADIWIRSPQTLALVVLPMLLLLAPPWIAALVTLVVYGAWYVYGPALITLPGIAVLRILNSVIVQAMLYIIVLSVLATQGYLGAMWTGLGAFVLLRWGIVDRIASRVLRPVVRTVYSLPLPDQVLRGVVLRHAIRMKVTMPEFVDIERSIRDRWA